jgi:hypothetical protein
MTADQLAILAFEAALDRNPWLWGQLGRLEQLARNQQPSTRDASRPESSASSAVRK